MTPFTNREGMEDLFDETVIEAVRAEAERYIRMNRKPPVSIGVTKAQYQEIRKAETAGVKPYAEFKGKPYYIAVHMATEKYRYPQLQRFHHEQREGRS